jgi:hypothetical protein
MRRILLLILFATLLLTLASLAYAVDFKSQKGRTIIAKGSLFTTITAGVEYTAPADINNAFIRMVGTKNTAAGGYVSGGTQAPAIHGAIVSNPQNLLTSITFRRYNASTLFSTAIEWEIIEYIGPAGGPNEFIVRDQNHIISSSNVRATGMTLNNITNPNKVVPFITGQVHNSTTASTVDRGLFTGAFTNFVPLFTRGDGTGDTNISYAIVEFTGKNWEISRAENASYATSSRWEVDKLLQVLNDVNQAFLHVQIDTNSGTNDESGHIAYLSDANALTSKVVSGASVPGFAKIHTVAWVIENTQTDGNRMNVWRYAGTQSTTTTKEWTTTITAVRDANRSSIFGTASSEGTTATPPSGNISFTFDNSTTVRLWRSDANNTNNYFIEVVEWPDAPTVTAGAAKTAFTFKVTATTTGHSVTYGGSCTANLFIFNEVTAFLDPDPDGNAAQVRPSATRLLGNPTYVDYNFSTTTNPADGNIAYGDVNNDNPPPVNFVPSTEFTNTQYSQVGILDGTVYTNNIIGTGKFPTSRYVFKALPDSNSIKDLNFTFVGNSHEGSQCGLSQTDTPQDLNIFFWNYETNQYDRYFTTNGSGFGTGPTDMNAEVHVDKNISQYIAGDSNITILLQGEATAGAGANKCIHTDFIQLRLHYFTTNPGYCQSPTLAPLYITNTGTAITNIDGNFASAFAGNDINIVLKVWMGTGIGCGANGMGGWEKDCSITGTTTPVNQAQCKQFNQTNATIGTRLVTSLAVGDTNQLCFSGDFNTSVGVGDHNENFQTGSNFS